MASEILSRRAASLTGPNDGGRAVCMGVSISRLSVHCREVAKRLPEVLDGARSGATSRRICSERSSRYNGLACAQIRGRWYGWMRTP